MKPADIVKAKGAVMTAQPGPQYAFLSTVADIAIFGGAAGGGKMLPLTTPLPTPSGWTTMGDVKVGDVVFDEKGNPCNVTAVHPIKKGPVSYKLTFSDGVEQLACADHEWLTFDTAELAALTRLDPEWRAARRARRPSKVSGRKSDRFAASLAKRNAERSYVVKPAPEGTVRTTAEIAASLRTESGRTNHAIPFAKPLELPDADLPIDPYVLGAWLGDGTVVTGVLTTADDQMVEYVRTAGYEVEKQPSNRYAYRIAGFTRLLKDNGLLGNKHVPQRYLRASFRQRLALLQGLMDTDGHACESGACEFMTTIESLRDGMSELLATLGVKSNWTEGRATLDGRDCGPKWRFKFATALKAFRLDRKIAIQKPATRRTTAFRYIVACDSVDSVPMRCITVDSPKHLYLCGRHMVPTHNSYAILLEATRHTKVPGFGAVIFRRTLADVKKEGSLWDTSVLLYGPFAKPRLDTLSWTFPAGTKVTFSHLEHEKNVLDWQGAQIPCIIFDELTHYSRKQFFYMLSRNRSTCGVTPYIRATCNPDSDSWVAGLISWWIDQDTGFAIPERSGVLRWFVRAGDEMRWADTKEELLIDYPDSMPKSLTFISSKLTDNKILMDADPGYRANLLALDRVERERLLNGNWKVRPSSGLYFQRHWCEIVDTIPAGTRFVRGWDTAATPKTEQNDPDWTCGTKIGRCPDGRYIVADHIYLQGAPLRVESAVLNTANADGRECRIHMPQDPAAAGKAQKEVYQRLLAGFNARFAVATGDKITRFSGFSAQADPGSSGGHGNVIVLRGPWNDRWFSQLEGFPEGKHDDDADATAEAFNGLVGKWGPGEALLEATREANRNREKAKPEEKLITYALGSVEFERIMDSAEP